MPFYQNGQVRMTTGELRAFGQGQVETEFQGPAILEALERQPDFDVYRETGLMPTYFALFLSEPGAREGPRFDVSGIWLFVSASAPVAAWGQGKVGRNGSSGWAQLLEPAGVQVRPDGEWTVPAVTAIRGLLVTHSITELHWRDLVRWLPCSLPVHTLARSGRPYRVFDLVFPVMD